MRSFCKSLTLVESATEGEAKWSNHIYIQSYVSILCAAMFMVCLQALELEDAYHDEDEAKLMHT